MSEQKTEFIGLRLPTRYKTYLQRLAVNEGLTMAQWIRKQLALQVWESIQSASGTMAAIQIAVDEFNVPVQEAMKLKTADEVYALIPPEKKAEFTERFEVIFKEILKKEMDECEFTGIEEELRQVNTLRVTKEEWEEAQEIPFKN
jgi:hypothetical protein